MTVLELKKALAEADDEAEVYISDDALNYHEAKTSVYDCCRYVFVVA